MYVYQLANLQLAKSLHEGTRNADIGYIGSYVEETVAVIDDEISSNTTIEVNQSNCN